MSTKPLLQILFATSLLSLTLSGCAEKPEPLRPLDKVKIEVETLSLEELQSAAREHVLKIMEKKPKLQKLEAKIERLTSKGASAEKTENLKKKAGELRAEVNQRALRYNEYAKKIKEQGGRVPKIRDYEEP